MDEMSSSVVFDGLILTRMCILIWKPDTIIYICDLKMELAVITLHPDCGNDVNNCISKMLALYQEINSRGSTESYISCRFLTNLFRALKICTVVRFEAFTIQLKQWWIMDDIKNKYNISKKIVKLSKNMGANS